ncbi:MAG: bifunctional oligoribonuclease/PAP phosphatase NrnA [Tannerella sp.]|jgi:phosphoesterase RecJ-like protein|nr:bifunctional oligoribonuclease/PAP phosphatase NrnA [Tannerella sp.]
MLTKKIDNDKIHKLKTIIKEGDDFVIVTHELPDGDAIGSSLALYRYLNTFDKKSITVIVPNEYPSFLKWLPGAKEIVDFSKFKDFGIQLIRKADVIFCLDFNAIKRVGRMDSVLVAADAKKVLIDHHLEPDNFCNLMISHPEVSSTSELIFRIICSLGAFEKLDKEMCECIYTGMMTDTGSFSYNSNDSEIYLIISELIKLGIDKDEIYRKVNQVYSEYRLRLMGYVLYEKMKIYKEKKTAMFALTQEELNRFHYRSGDTEGFVNLPLSMDGISFSVFLREETNLIKISFRSLGDFPCNKFAAKYFNGGGHKNASGGEYYGKLDDAIKVFEEGLSKFNSKSYWM